MIERLARQGNSRARIVDRGGMNMEDAAGLLRRTSRRRGRGQRR